ncbi:MAG: hypothetical protein ACTHKJ_08910 [Candidatus Nitrosocosmicus sp.]
MNNSDYYLWNIMHKQIVLESKGKNNSFCKVDCINNYYIFYITSCKCPLIISKNESNEQTEIIKGMESLSQLK